MNGLALTSNKVIYTDVANNVYAATTNISGTQKPVQLTQELESPKGAVMRFEFKYVGMKLTSTFLYGARS